MKLHATVVVIRFFAAYTTPGLIKFNTAALIPTQHAHALTHQGLGLAIESGDCHPPTETLHHFAPMLVSNLAISLYISDVAPPFLQVLRPSMRLTSLSSLALEAERCSGSMLVLQPEVE